MLLVNTNHIVPYWTFGDADSNAAIIEIGQWIHVDLKIFFSRSYCINIGFYLLLKAKKLSARDHPVMERLVQYQKVCFVTTAWKGLKETGRFVTNLS